jgi:hypothetical protein
LLSQTTAFQQLWRPRSNGLVVAYFINKLASELIIDHPGAVTDGGMATGMLGGGQR